MGMAGLGVASTQIIPAVSALPYLQLTAAADFRVDALTKFRKEYDAKVFTSVEAMCQSPDVDFVYIATPNELHTQHAVTAAKHKKHVIVEKPMALSLEECAAMNDGAEQNGVNLLCGHRHRSHPPIRKSRHLVTIG